MKNLFSQFILFQLKVPIIREKIKFDDNKKYKKCEKRLTLSLLAGYECITMTLRKSKKKNPEKEVERRKC